MNDDRLGNSPDLEESVGGFLQFSVDWILARSEGFEPPTLGIEIRCSIQLSYERLYRTDYQIWHDRASGRNRSRSMSGFRGSFARL